MVIMKVITGVEVRSYWSRVGPYSTITAVTVETTQCGETNTHLGRRPCEEEGRDQSDTYWSVIQRLPASYQKLGEKRAAYIPSQP